MLLWVEKKSPLEVISGTSLLFDAGLAAIWQILRFYRICCSYIGDDSLKCNCGVKGFYWGCLSLLSGFVPVSACTSHQKQKKKFQEMAPLLFTFWQIFLCAPQRIWEFPQPCLTDVWLFRKWDVWLSRWNIGANILIITFHWFCHILRRC